MPAFRIIEDIQKRNMLIVKVYKEGYSQHKIVKVLDMAQSTIHGVIKDTARVSAIVFI